MKFGVKCLSHVVTYVEYWNSSFQNREEHMEFVKFSFWVVVKRDFDSPYCADAKVKTTNDDKITEE